MQSLKALTAAIALASLTLAGPAFATPTDSNPATGARTEGGAETGLNDQYQPIKDERMASERRPDIRSGESVEDEMEDVRDENE